MCFSTTGNSSHKNHHMMSFSYTSLDHFQWSTFQLFTTAQFLKKEKKAIEQRINIDAGERQEFPMSAFFSRS
ncbi:hypothetical protein NECAME_15628 [Necator americanus]|uniref:Uncharacterized protein n=1 Tax=Necator americanus TaxID=51031 RepID=W2SIX5_NECAM|nr:hypothetical protein NECAME_15628 [Necator americanus]ETN68796.1 hypothetical protein NECAME_15628 [Necator americanus]